MKDNWIPVTERPLYTIELMGDKPIWVCTDDGGKEFFAAVPYESKKQPGEQLWWIRHCVVEDRVGLCVVGDDDNEPAGWQLKDVTHWQPIPEPPSK